MQVKEASRLCRMMFSVRWPSLSVLQVRPKFIIPPLVLVFWQFNIRSKWGATMPLAKNDSICIKKDKKKLNKTILLKLSLKVTIYNQWSANYNNQGNGDRRYFVHYNWPKNLQSIPVSFSKKMSRQIVLFFNVTVFFCRKKLCDSLCY